MDDNWENEYNVIVTSYNGEIGGLKTKQKLKVKVVKRKGETKGQKGVKMMTYRLLMTNGKGRWKWTEGG